MWKLKRSTIKIIIGTSFIWFAVDVVFLISWLGCRNSYCSLDEWGPDNPIKDLGDVQEAFLTQDDNIFNSNLTKIEYSKEKLHNYRERSPVPEIENGPGEMGARVKTPPELTQLKKEKFKINQFNLVVSEMISVNRSLKDVRMESCKSRVYPDQLPTTSIVIVFHNEAWSTLLRSLHSIINRSPLELLQEIILVDDASSGPHQAHLGAELERYVAQLPVPVKIVRSAERVGLIRARLLGAAEAEGSVLTFLDSHVECTQGWLEPLLTEVARDRRTVVCPIIDVISDDTFQYVPASDLTWGGFNWKLNFRWYTVPSRETDRRQGDRSLPVRTPTMAGGLFSVDREYFYHIGAYDEGMEIWGGENLEMSFRVWMCGGTLLIATCSRVGHVFRKTTPYTFPGGTSAIVHRNNARLAEVWMDEWKQFYFSINPLARKVDMGDIGERVALRQRLQCRSFRWYLENIYPESVMPLNYHHLGTISVTMDDHGRPVCLDSMGKSSGSEVSVTHCHGLGGNQVFAMTRSHQIMTDDNCLDSSVGAGEQPVVVKLVKCHGQRGNQAWTHDQDTGNIVHSVSGQCLSVRGQSLVLDTCQEADQAQVWSLDTPYQGHNNDSL